MCSLPDARYCPWFTARLSAPSNSTLLGKWHISASQRTRERRSGTASKNKREWRASGRCPIPEENAAGMGATELGATALGAIAVAELEGDVSMQ